MVSARVAEVGRKDWDRDRRETPPKHVETVSEVKAKRPGQNIQAYPSILAAGYLLSQSADDLGQPFVAFDKPDGSNVRADWDCKMGWHLFGSRRRLLDPSQPLLGQAIRLILDGTGDGLARVFRDAPAFQGTKEETTYFKFFGPHSFAGQHAPEVLKVPSNEPFRVVLLDVNIHKRGFVSAKEGIAHFGHLGILRVVHRGTFTRQFLEEARKNQFDRPEGVICKGGVGHWRWMANIKTTAYFQRLKTFFQGDWQKYW